VCENDCYLADTTLKDAELQQGAGGKGRPPVRRHVGRPTPALITVITTDNAHQAANLRDGEYQTALFETLNVIKSLSAHPSRAPGRGFAFVTAVVANARDIAFKPRPGEEAFSSQGIGDLAQAIKAELGARSAAVPVEQLRTVVETLFAERQMARNDHPPAAIIHVGDVLKPRGGSNFCNSSLKTTVANWEWLPRGARQLLKISFVAQGNVNQLVASRALRSVDGASQNAIFQCASNVPKQVEEYIVVAPSGQVPGEPAAEVERVLISRAADLFNLKLKAP
jgi:hypothetical protein